MLRRALLNYTGLAAVGLVAACVTGPNGTTTLATPAQVVADVAQIATAFGATLPALQAVIPTKNTTVFPAIQNAVADIVKLAPTVTADITTVQAQPSVANIATDVTAIVSALAVAGVVLPPTSPFALALVAAQVLVPVIELALGMVVPASVSTHGLTPATARAQLARVIAGAKK